MSTLRLNVTETIRFFDEIPEGSYRHATAIVGVAGEDLAIALLVKHLAELYGEARFVQKRCTTGKQKGPRLDGWVGAWVDGTWTLFQVEVKNWSAHAIGGKPLPLNATEEEQRAHRIERWKNQWEEDRFRHDSVQKVLVEMKPPEVAPVEALVCFWDPMHPLGEPSSLFQVATRAGRFSRVWVFSVSTYLRGLTVPQVDLHMPDATARLSWLNRLMRVISVS